MEITEAKFWLKGVVVATVEGLLLLALTPNAESATAASTTIVPLSPHAHGLSDNVESTYSADPLVAPRSARSIRLLLADATLILDIATYRVFGQDFESRGTAALETTSYSVVIALPYDFLKYRPAIRPFAQIHPSPSMTGSNCRHLAQRRVPFLPKNTISASMSARARAEVARRRTSLFKRHQRAQLRPPPWICPSLRVKTGNSETTGHILMGNSPGCRTCRRYLPVTRSP